MHQQNKNIQQNEQVNLYKILGVSRESTDKDIKKAFNKLIIKHHPDRGGDPEIYEIIVNSYNVLIDPISRKQYDDLYKLNEDTRQVYVDMKSQSKNFLDTQNKKITANDHKHFKQGWEELNKKHGYYEEDKNNITIPKNEAMKRWQELDKIRNTQYEQDKPNILFEQDKPVDMNTFNAAFEKTNGTILDIVSKKDIPDAWSGNVSSMTSYSKLDDISNIYDESNDINDLHGINFGSINFNQKSQKKLTKDDIKNIDKIDYYNNHNIIEKDYYNKIKEKLSDRTKDSNTFNDKQMHQYDKDNTAGYGIFDKLGIKYDDNLQITDWENKDVNEAYQKLLQDRK